MGIAAKFWSGKRVFITGHTGFKGSWLCWWLNHLGANVYGYALAPHTNPSMFDALELNQHINSTLGDIRDLAKLQAALTRAAPDVVIHMAAQPLVRDSYKNPIDTYAINVMGTVNLFEAIRQSGIACAVVNVTTDKCYENKEWPWGYRENEPMGGYDPYSNSKGCSELVTASFRQSFFHPEQVSKHGVALASARAGNVIGGGDWATDRLVPDMIRAFSQNQEVVLRHPHAVRPWQHVLEPLSGYLVLARHLVEKPGQYCEGWNFGPRNIDCQSVEAVVSGLCDNWRGATWRVESDENALHEAHLLKLDISKAQALLGWTPRWHLAVALEKTAHWYRAFYQGEDVAALTQVQIEQYEKSRK